jgi:hypothetical protein
MPPEHPKIFPPFFLRGAAGVENGCAQGISRTLRMALRALIIVIEIKELFFIL